MPSAQKVDPLRVCGSNHNVATRRRGIGPSRYHLSIVLNINYIFRKFTVYFISADNSYTTEILTNWIDSAFAYILVIRSEETRIVDNLLNIHWSFYQVLRQPYSSILTFYLPWRVQQTLVIAASSSQPRMITSPARESFTTN